MCDTLFDLHGKVAALTGGAGMICGCMARARAERGMKVAVLDVVPDAAGKVADEIVSGGGEAIAVECNVLDTESIRGAASQIIAKYGGVDILINGAGVVECCRSDSIKIASQLKILSVLFGATIQ